MQKRTIANDIFMSEVTRLISEGSKVTFTPKGVSMLPFIRGNRDSVVLTSPKDLQKIDIVLAKIGDIYVLHRIIDIQGDKLKLMGDGNVVGVEYCTREDVIAWVESIIKDGKEYDCRSRKHHLKAKIWWLLRPLRRYMLAIYRRLFL